MNNNVVLVAITLFLGTVGISSKTFATLLENANQLSGSQITKINCNVTPLKPEAIHAFALNAPTKSEALEFLKKAEECYTKEGNQAGVKKVRNQIAQIDTINFVQNRRRLIDSLKIAAEDSRQQGKPEEAAKYQARIRQLDQLRE